MAIVSQSNSALALVNRIDQVKAFWLFTYFGGDEAKTAQAVGCDLCSIHSLAHDFGWLDRIKGHNRLDSDEGRKAEQEANRAANYVMARRIGSVIEHIVLRASDDPAQWAQMNCVEIDKETGEKTFTSKPLVEIAKAAQIVQDMTYRAIGDKLAGQASTTQASDGSVTNLMVNVYHGLSKLEGAMKQATKLADATLSQEAVAAIDRV